MIMSHCLAILMQIRNRVPCLIFKKIYYTANSLVADMATEEGEEYTIEIMSKGKGCQHRSCVNLLSERLCLECGKVI